jgi:hypothetical protein
MDGSELGEILAKIAFRAPFDEWDLTDKEYNILK